ncbi:glycoside hydrolase [Microlunatus sp. GCM10028923]|uniref:GH39 family glycosyl hydrolase n=1 Tax=Microlunatus sp. GCM10028923 TaxID=3273400 RepID=UPI00360B16C1
MSTETQNPHVSRRAGSPFPPAAPSDPDAPHVERALIEVDAAADLGPIEPVWRSIGYDEFNWTYTRTGKRLLRSFGEISGDSYHVRPHYVFCSGSGFGIPHWSSGNVYHEDENGNPYYDFTLVDQAYDAIVAAGHHVLVELGFTPRDLVPDVEFTVPSSPTLYGAYEAGAWRFPPRDYGRWAGLIEAHARHCAERYGMAEVSEWLWELWNEPDIFYWGGTVQQYNELYTVTAQAVRAAIPGAKVGGPSVTSGGLEFLKEFLDYTSSRGEPLDFISYHTKGCHFPTRDYRPIGAPATEQASPSSTKMLYDIVRCNRIIADYPEYRDLEVLVDECDAAVPAHFGRYDNANYAFQNTEYYPVFQAKLFKKILDLNAAGPVSVNQATSWSFYFEAERWFEGTRSFLTADGTEKPLLNAYRMFGRLGSHRVAARSDQAWSIEALADPDGSSMPEEVDALATTDEDGTVAILVWRHTDDQYQRAEAATPVRIAVSGLDHTGYRLSHLRIDHDHSNAHTVWASLGSPSDPGDDEIAKIQARQGLEEFEPARDLDPDPSGGLALEVALPLPAVSLLILTPRS